MPPLSPPPLMCIYECIRKNKKIILTFFECLYALVRQCVETILLEFSLNGQLMLNSKQTKKQKQMSG
jgi:hypothetical protein